VQPAKYVPGIDVVIGDHSRTELCEAIIVNGRAPVVRTGKESNKLGEFVIAVDGDKLTVTSCKVLLIDHSILGDRAIAKDIEQLKRPFSATRSRRGATASTSRWPLPRATRPPPTPTSLPARGWPTSSPTRSAARRRPTSGSPPTE